MSFLLGPAPGTEERRDQVHTSWPADAPHGVNLNLPSKYTDFTKNDIFQILFEYFMQICNSQKFKRTLKVPKWKLLG